jgi:hypothetical protein
MQGHRVSESTAIVRTSRERGRSAVAASSPLTKPTLEIRSAAGGLGPTQNQESIGTRFPILLGAVLVPELRQSPS